MLALVKKEKGEGFLELEERPLRILPMVTVRPLTKCMEVFELLEEGKVLKVLLTPVE